MPKDGLISFQANVGIKELQKVEALDKKRINLAILGN